MSQTTSTRLSWDVHVPLLRMIHIDPQLFLLVLVAVQAASPQVHYVNDAERGVVWEEVIILLPAEARQWEQVHKEDNG